MTVSIVTTKTGRSCRRPGWKQKEAQRLAESAQSQVHDRRECYRRLSPEYDGLGRISEVVRDKAAATHSFSCGTNCRDCNEVKYLLEALDLMERFHRQDTHREESESTFVELSSSSRG